MSDQTFRVFTTTSEYDILASSPAAARSEVKKRNPRANITKVKVVRSAALEVEHG